MITLQNIVEDQRRDEFAWHFFDVDVSDNITERLILIGFVGDTDMAVFARDKRSRPITVNGSDTHAVLCEDIESVSWMGE